MSNESNPFSLKHKIKSSIRCFRSDHDELEDNEEIASPKTPRSPCVWLKPTANEIPELRGRCRNLVSRIGRCRRRYHHSADFSYDPSSYALNFENDNGRGHEEFPFRDFISRLPASPPPSPRFPAENYGRLEVLELLRVRRM